MDGDADCIPRNVMLTIIFFSDTESPLMLQDTKLICEYIPVCLLTYQANVFPTTALPNPLVVKYTCVSTWVIKP